MSRTVTSGDFPACVRRSRAIIRSLLERTAEPAQAEPDSSSAGRSLERRSRPESFGLRFDTFRLSLFMFLLIPLFVSLFPLLILSHLSFLVLS
jgi:hypothetical protein